MKRKRLLVLAGVVVCLSLTSIVVSFWPRHSVPPNAAQLFVGQLEDLFEDLEPGESGDIYVPDGGADHLLYLRPYASRRELATCLTLDEGVMKHLLALSQNGRESPCLVWLSLGKVIEIQWLPRGQYALGSPPTCWNFGDTTKVSVRKEMVPSDKVNGLHSLEFVPPLMEPTEEGEPTQ